MAVPRMIPGRRVALFSFGDLCDEAVGAVDFLALARRFRVLFLSHVPELTLGNRNQVRSHPSIILLLH